MADQINEKFLEIRTQDPEAKILLVGVLNGAYIFLSELSKKMKTNVDVDFIKCRSYRGMES